MNKQQKKELQIFWIFPIVGFIFATIMAVIYTGEPFWVSWIVSFTAVNALGLYAFIICFSPIIIIPHWFEEKGDKF